jgi:VIT1/CCC1 family predicted Fe2+/Mn2+ transporter
MSFADISLWIAVMAIILLLTSELLTSSTGPLRNVGIDKRILRSLALALGMAFMTTVVMRFFNFA